ncbi:hypothetical protein J3Q64DRAFT_1704328 [Phycomyces blakesleeanus]|uniref:Uncharacterized protein n=1 Tax=Phycomyces blakesleeanus TaxID=4837 RepID=A0ABR3AIU3_PHYBL
MNNNTNSILDSYESTDNALIDSFKAAALKVTTLYKDSLVQNRKAYAAGYQQALQDLYGFISSHPSTTVSQQGDPYTGHPVERGFLPVQDLLEFARERNTQLTSEMGSDDGMAPAQSQSMHITQPATSNPHTQRPSPPEPKTPQTSFGHSNQTVFSSGWLQEEIYTFRLLIYGAVNQQYEFGRMVWALSQSVIKVAAYCIENTNIKRRGRSKHAVILITITQIDFPRFF